MQRFLIAIVAVAVVLVSGPAFAFQCPKLVAEINGQVGNRFDATAHTARAKAAEADKLHKEGKHAEAEKAAKEGLTALGKKM
jgi:hypothetical protein